MTTWVKGRQLSTIRNQYNDDLSEGLPVIDDTITMTTWVKGRQLSTIRNQYNDELSEGLSVINDTQSLLAARWWSYGLSSRLAPAEVAVVGSQSEAIRAERLYVEPTGLLGAMRILHTGGE